MLRAMAASIGACSPQARGICSIRSDRCRGLPARPVLGRAENPLDGRAYDHLERPGEDLEAGGTFPDQFAVDVERHGRIALDLHPRGPAEEQEVALQVP